jgi:hypothetical protein
MPGPALHHMIADKLKSQIYSNQGLGPALALSQYEALQKLLSKNNNLPYFYLGCQGPDFLFFNTKDMPKPIGDIADIYFEVTDFIENFKRTLLALVPQPILDAVDAVDAMIDNAVERSATLSEIKQMFEDINRLLEGLKATFMELGKKFLTDFNLFDILSHPYRDGVPEPKGKWWWFDALHYRKTGKFAQALLKATTSGNFNDPKILYALGYLTHYCADTVGHPYVNLISGGPYRSHAQRHKTGENYQDVFNLYAQTGQDWNRSKMHVFYNFNFDGTIDTENNKPDTYTELPTDLAKLIADTINKVYQEDSDSDPKYGHKITAKDVNEAYRIYFMWLKNSTDTGTLPAPVPYSFSAEMREVWEKAKDNVRDAGHDIGDAVNGMGSGSIWGFFAALFKFILGLFELAAALADIVTGSITTLSTSTIRAAACLIYEQIFNAYQGFRLGVAMNGLAFPMKEHLSDFRLTQFANPSNPDPDNVNAQHLMPFLPLLKKKNIFPGIFSFFPQEEHLVYPKTQEEKNSVMAALDSYLDQPATHYAFGNISFNPPEILDILEGLTQYDDPNKNDDGSQLNDYLLKEASLGNAMTLIEKSYERFQNGKNLIDFNLDGDRGYSYLCWTQNQNGVDKPDFPRRLIVNDPSGTPAAQNMSVKLNFIK